MTPVAPSVQTGRRVAVIGSGPAGLAAAQQLTRAGHAVTVYERDDQPGGLLRYGIPEFKMEKRLLDRRLDQMRAEGTEFVCGVAVGRDNAPSIRATHDAVVLAVGATVARELPIPGRDLAGIHQAMEYLPLANRAVDAADPRRATPITAAGKRVVIIGGGDTGADCLGTVHRQGAVSVHQFEIMPRPPDARDPSTPWPTWPLMFRTSSAHEEGGERVFAVNTVEFAGDEAGRVRGSAACGSRCPWWTGGPASTRSRARSSSCRASWSCWPSASRARNRSWPRPSGCRSGPGAPSPAHASYDTDVPGVFVCGDAGRGQSLIVWAIAEGRSAAAAVDRHLSGDTLLPAPLPNA